MRERQAMGVTTADPDQSILTSTVGHPVFLGREADGRDHTCGQCGEHVLMENIAEGEVFDIVIRCPGCGALNAAPARQRGYPLPIKRTAIVRRGEHSTDTTYEITEGYTVASALSQAQYLEEIGEAPSGPFVVSDAAHLDGLLGELRALLGQTFAKLEASDSLAVANGSGHDRHRHPLMVRVVRVRALASALRGGPPSPNPDADLVALTQLIMIVRLYQQFARNPQWARILADIPNRENFAHDIINLAFLAFSANNDNGIGLQDTALVSGRLADLRMAATARGHLVIEVKTPKALQTSGDALKPTQAQKIVRDAFSSASTGAGGQLGPHNWGLLVVGALRLPEGAVSALAQAALREFNRARMAKQHIAGVAIVSLSQQQNTAIVPYPLLDATGVIHPRPTVWDAQIHCHIAFNPWYSGPIRLTNP